MNNAREIAERLFPFAEVWETKCEQIAVRSGGVSTFIFNPYENWNDCGMVLEALNNTPDIDLMIFTDEVQGRRILNLMTGTTNSNSFCADDLKTAICEAFLSMEVL